MVLIDYWKAYDMVPNMSNGELGIKHGGLLVSTVVCSCDDPSHHVGEKGEHWVQYWEGLEVDQPFVVLWMI